LTAQDKRERPLPLHRRAHRLRQDRRRAGDCAGADAVEIISVDSALVYRGMDIGTAKPTPENSPPCRTT
jgi:hypothetical protein